jgi:probable F420-dependent oxidoreductase
MTPLKASKLYPNAAQAFSTVDKHIVITGDTMDLGKLGVWYFLDGLSSPDAAAAAQRIEKLGYNALWIPETVGKNPLVLASWLLANTSELVIATGIVNIYHREPGVTMAAQKTLAEQSGGRFLLGMGVSHKPLVEGVRGLEYGPPVATMRAYLEKMAASPYSAIAPDEEPPTVIAALGPKMLELAAQSCQGAHPYFTSPEHTKMAREIMGPDTWLCVEQKVILETDAAIARGVARPAATMYAALPNYRNNWLRMGLAEEDINDLSDKFIDATFAWGSAEDIRQRIDEHFDAGASHVCIQPINPNGKMGDLDWECLEQVSSI